MRCGIDRLVKSKLFYITLILIASGCTESENKKNTSNYEELVVKVPAKIQQFDHIDSLYYSFLGLNSFATDEGGVILPIWGPATLVKTNRDGNEVLAKTAEGRGPGELMDVGVPTMGENEIYVYDQNLQKIVIFDREDLSLIEEFLVGSHQEYRVDRAYPTFEKGSLLLELSNSQLVVDKMDDKLLIKYDLENEEYGESIALKGKLYAPLGDLINGRAGTAMMVPFSDSQFIVAAPERRSLLLYDTRTDLIAEINADFDTLRTISVDLPTEEISSTEKDSIKAEVEGFHTGDWGDVESLLPEVKAGADNMLFNNDKIWLKSNLRGSGDIWLVLNMEGEITDLVSLPKDTFLTHVSEHHLGVRLDEANFALYENPVGD
ncbi:MAG TPA: hypothetical protein VFM80_12320 [Gracilimonas sp.]|uniref:hypothetical protein n=1 Tax=Gracilimonas sp. TaxID=1974203 RepID=UPI002D8F8100|nr:hypothetical protein [Gracilimonas sp.]